MDRYKDLSSDNHVSRCEQRKKLYESLDSNVQYTTLADVTSSNVIDLNNRKNANTREGYHQMKEYQDVIPVPKVKKELEEFNNIYLKNSTRVYDINNVIEEARKNRNEADIENEKKLKNTSYNIIADLSAEKLEKYRKEKTNKVIKPTDDNLKETIDTIASATLAGDIKAASDLLSDLMVTSIMEKVSDEDDDDDDEVFDIDGISSNTDTDVEIDLDTNEDDDDLKEGLTDSDMEKINELAKDSDNVSELGSDVDSEFYTRSMELSKDDFDMDDDFVEKKMSIWIKLLIVLVILIILGVAGYFIYKSL